MLVQINPAQPRILNHHIRHNGKHSFAITRLRIEYLFQSALPAKIVWLVPACFFLCIILAKDPLSFTEEIKLSWESSVQPSLNVTCKWSRSSAPRALLGEDWQGPDPFRPLCINSWACCFEWSYIVGLTLMFCRSFSLDQGLYGRPAGKWLGALGTSSCQRSVCWRGCSLGLLSDNDQAKRV